MAGSLALEWPGKSLETTDTSERKVEIFLKNFPLTLHFSYASTASSQFPKTEFHFRDL